jgi:hypothetical protein
MDGATKNSSDDDAKKSVVRSIRFPEKLLAELLRRAEEQDRSLNNLVLRFCKEGLKANSGKSPKRKPARRGA